VLLNENGTSADVVSLLDLDKNGTNLKNAMNARDASMNARRRR